MDQKKFEDLLKLVKDPEKRKEIESKYQNLLQSRSEKNKGAEDPLKDDFKVSAKGHILIEEIDKNGEVVGVMADQPNLVVDGAEEIMLRAFSGDPKRRLYKNRKLKEGETSSEVFFVDRDQLGGFPMYEHGQILHDQNIFWENVDEEQFDCEFSYYPTVMYLEYVESDEKGKEGFRIHATKSNPDFAPIPSELYSGFTNMFIGLGDGTNYNVNLNDPRLTYEGTWTGEETKTTTEETAKVSFEEKITNFEVDLKFSNTGGQVDVMVDGVLKETVETLDSEAAQAYVKTFTFKELDHESATKVELVFSGSDSEIVGDPSVEVAAIRFDALHKGMNQLMREFRTVETVFDTSYFSNTTPMAPFTIKLKDAPVKKGSVGITYENAEFEEVQTLEEVDEGKFYVDHDHGYVHFNRALTGVGSTHEITGEVAEDRTRRGMNKGVDVTNVTTSDIRIEDEQNSATPDGERLIFSVSNVMKTDLVEVKLQGAEETTTVDVSEYNVDVQEGQVIFTVAPEGEALMISYDSEETTQETFETLEFEPEFEIKDEQVRLYDNDANALVKAEDENDFGYGKFLVKDGKLVLVADKRADGEDLEKLDAFYFSDEKPVRESAYKRQVVQKPKEVNKYPWFNLDRGSVTFVAEFDEEVPNHIVTVREMGLFDGPRYDDKIAGFKGHPVKAFSLVRIGEARKDNSTGMRITWTITLEDKDGNPFQGGK